MKYIWAILTVLVAIGHANFVTVRQDPDKVATFEIIDATNGATLQSEKPTFDGSSLTFSWPYAEMTSNLIDNSIYAVFFPDNSNNSIFYQLNSTLHTQRTWSSTPFWFFDLQYLPQQNSLYGIKVISTYGRAFSRFHLENSKDMLSATELFVLPDMWYVNASTTDNVKNRYIALLNYFPNKPESTLDQKLFVADLHTDFSGKDTSFSVLPISHLPEKNVGIVHFIAFSQETKHLFALSLTNDDTQKAFLSSLDTSSGQVQNVHLVVDNVHEVGPLVVNEKENVLTFFVKLSVSSSWQLIQVNLNKFSSNAKLTYNTLRCFESDDYAIFSAAAKF